jgi:hypothetical protein
MTASDLQPDLRALIDARLDTIDQILIRAQVPWSERRSVVGEVETQIFELLSRRSSAPTQEDLLAVLGSIDPPEAYFPEHRREAIGAATAGAGVEQTDWRALATRGTQLANKFGRGAALILTVVVVNGVVLAIIAASEGVIPWLVTLGGLAWLNYEAVKRYRAWTNTGRRSLLDDVRFSLAAWLLPKRGAQAT